MNQLPYPTQGQSVWWHQLSVNSRYHHQTDRNGNVIYKRQAYAVEAPQLSGVRLARTFLNFMLTIQNMGMIYFFFPNLDIFLNCLTNR